MPGKIVVKSGLSQSPNAFWYESYLSHDGPLCTTSIHLALHASIMRVMLSADECCLTWVTYRRSVVLRCWHRTKLQATSAELCRHEWRNQEEVTMASDWTMEKWSCLWKCAKLVHCGFYASCGSSATNYSLSGPVITVRVRYDDWTLTLTGAWKMCTGPLLTWMPSYDAHGSIVRLSFPTACMLESFSTATLLDYLIHESTVKIIGSLWGKSGPYSPLFRKNEGEKQSWQIRIFRLSGTYDSNAFERNESYPYLLL